MKSAITIIAATLIALCTCGNVQAEPPDVQFRAPTPADEATVTEPTIQAEATIAELDHPELLPDLTEVTFRWDGVDYTLYDSSLVLMFNFNNVFELGEDYQNQPGLGVRDLSLSANDGYLSSNPLIGIPSWTESAKFAGAFDFAASNSESILVAHDPSLNPGDGDFAIVLWILPEQNVDSDIIRKGSTLTSDGMWYKLEHSAGSNNKISLNFNTNGTDATISSSDSYADQNWHFVLAQRKGDQAELWIDGVLDGTVAVTGEIFNDADMAIGSKDTQDDDFFNGMITEVRMYMKSFSPDEVELLYDSMLGIYPVEPTKWLLETKRDGLESGDYVYAASATNALSQTYTSERTVTVALPAPPDVTLVSPANGSVLNDPVVTFTVDAADPVGLVDATLYIGTPEQVATFSGPDETDDAQISATNPDTTYGSATSINVDGENPHAHAVIKFPNLIGGGPGQVPLDTTIVSATLQVNCTNLGAMMQVYRLTSDWAEETVTWNSPWVSPGGDYDPATVINGDCTATGLRTIDVTEFVQAWSDGLSNCGILLTDTGTDGVDFDSSEGAIPPVLTVVYAGDWQPVQIQTMSGTSDTATFAGIALQDMTDYVWNCLVTNAAETPMSSWAPDNFNLSIDGQTPDEPVLVGPADGATSVSIPATLEVTVSDPQTEDSLDVTFYGRKKVSTESEFTIVALPDTQKYVLNGTYSHIFMDQIQWIIDNKDALNIVFVTHEGDIVETWNSTSQWEDANECMSLLDGIVPYSVVPGDHDHYGEDPPGSTEYYEQYFPASRFANAELYPYWGGSYAGNFGGSYDETYPHTNNSNFQLLTIGGEAYIFLSLDFCPSQDEIDWANGILTTHSERRAVLTTHGLLDTNANYYGSGDFWLYPDGSSNSSGDTSLIWYDLIRNHENLQLVLCGHMHGETRRTDNNLFGKPVHQLLANYQGRSNGGDGWLRIMRFVPAENKIYVQTYSPWLNEYEADGDSQFELDMPMSLFTEIGTNLDVENGSNTSVVWTDLAEQSEYEWYVTVTDSTDRTSIGPDWSFTSAMANQPPTANDDSDTTDEDTPVTIDVLANDLDPEGDPFAVDSVTQPSNGTVTNNGTDVTYTPDDNFNGVDTFTYTAADATNSSDPATVTVTVNAINDAPVADDQAVAVKEDIPTAVTLTGSDVDEDPLTYYVVDGPVNGLLSGTAPDLTYTPNPGYTGPDSFTFKANDATVDSDLATVTITVNANSAPVANPDSYSIEEDGTLNVDAASGVLFNDTDADGDSLTAVPVGDVTQGVLTLNSDGSFTYTPNTNVNGSDSFTYKANDGTADSTPTTVSITITPVNDDPVANDDSATTDEDTAKTIDVLGNDTDVDEDSLSVTSVTQPANGTVVNNGTDVTYTPNDDFFGSDPFTYTAGDGNGGSDSATVNVTVNSINDPPTANDDSASTLRDVPVNIDVLSNDNDTEGDTLSVGSVTQPTNGSVVNNGANVTYTPNPGYVEDDSFTYTANDGTSSGNAATVTVTINAPGPTTLFSDGFESGNLATGGWTSSSSGSVVIKEPAAYEGVYGVQIGGVAWIAKSVSTIGFSDIHVKYARKTKGLDSGESLTVEWSVDGETWNNVIETQDTAWAQRDIALGAGAGENAAFSVRFRTNANKTNEYGSVDSVEISGTPSGPVNQPPVANNDAYSVDEDGTLIISAPGVLANDSDPESYPLTAAQVGGVANGALSLNPDGSFNYTPNANYNGSDSFTYMANDGVSNSDTATVTITVNSINDAPVANNDSTITSEDTAVIVDVLANDTDADVGDTLSVELATNGANGIVIVNGDNTVTYTPNAAYNGDDSFTYTISDGKGGTDTATVSITVTEFNNPPVANDDDGETNEDTDVTILVLANDTDADVGDTLSVQSATNGANGSVVNNGGSVTYTPNANFNGTDVFTYTVSDGKGGTDTGSVTVTVLAVNDSPSAADDSAATDEDTAVVIDVLANDSDIDGDVLTVDSVTQGLNGTVVNNGGSVTYTPDPGFTGTDNFTYTANDGNGGTDTGTVTITVNHVGSIVYVASIDMLDFVPAGRNSKAVAGITLNVPEVGATVIGDWYFNGEVIQTGAGGTTDAGGYTEIVSVPVKATSGDVLRFVITDVVLTGYTYDSNQGVTENSITFP